MYLLKISVVNFVIKFDAVAKPKYRKFTAGILILATLAKLVKVKKDRPTCAHSWSVPALAYIIISSCTPTLKKINRRSTVHIF